MQGGGPPYLFKAFSVVTHPEDVPGLSQVVGGTCSGVFVCPGSVSLRVRPYGSLAAQHELHLLLW